MTPSDALHDAASALVEEAHAFHRAAEHEDSHVGAPAALECLQEALQVLSAAWYRLAANASPDLVERQPARGAQAGSRSSRDGLSREQEVRLIGAVHDVAAAFARCARACRAGKSTVAPVIAASWSGAGEAVRR
jgi:hypothetical protein